MRIHIADAGTITLLEPANFRGLDVLIDPMPADRLLRLIARIGRPEGSDHIRLFPAVLRFLSPLAGDPDWEAGFAAMLGYADKHGWVDPEGAVRAHIAPPEPHGAITTAEFRQTLRRLAGGVCAVTTGGAAAPMGMVASSVVSISAEPPLIGVFVHETSSSLPALLAARVFGVNVLGAAHEALVQDFVRLPQGPGRFSGASWHQGALDVPLLQGALATMECRLVNDLTLGTHRLLVGRIEHSTSGDGKPMVQFDGALLRPAGETA